jgi:hypothetical protein
MIRVDISKSAINFLQISWIPLQSQNGQKSRKAILVVRGPSLDNFLNLGKAHGETLAHAKA